MLEQLIELFEEVAENDRLFELNAICAKKAIDALIDKGFSKEDATQLIIHQGFGVNATR